MKNNSNFLGSRFVKRSFSTSLVMAALATLSACGGSDDKIEDQPTPTMSTFSLSVSDAPVDDASEVVVYFDEVELIGNESPTRSQLKMKMVILKTSTCCRYRASSLKLS